MSAEWEKPDEAITIFFAFFSLTCFGNTQQPASIQIYLFYVDPRLEGILELCSEPPIDLSISRSRLDIENPSIMRPFPNLRRSSTGGNNPGSSLESSAFRAEEITEGCICSRISNEGRRHIIPSLEIPLTAAPSEKAFLDLAYFYQKGCQKCDGQATCLNT
jgi:hypothetical protein